MYTRDTNDDKKKDAARAGTLWIISHITKQQENTPSNWSRKRHRQWGSFARELFSPAAPFSIGSFIETHALSFSFSPSFLLSSLSLSKSVDQLITAMHRIVITTAAIVTSRRTLLAAWSTRLLASCDHRLSPRIALCAFCRPCTAAPLFQTSASPSSLSVYRAFTFGTVFSVLLSRTPKDFLARLNSHPRYSPSTWQYLR